MRNVFFSCIDRKSYRFLPENINLQEVIFFYHTNTENGRFRRLLPVAKGFIYSTSGQMNQSENARTNSPCENKNAHGTFYFRSR